MNSVPLSVMRTLGVPHLLMINSFRASEINFPVALRRALTSIHFVKISYITKTYLNLERLTGKGPMMSAAITVHGCSTILCPIRPTGIPWSTLQI